MSWISGHEVAQLADAAIDAYCDERGRLNVARQAMFEALQTLEAKLAQAWEQLTVTLVPGLVAEHLDWLANLLHMPAIAAAAVHERIAIERASLEAAIAGVDEDPDYVEREARLATCAIEIAEIERPLAPLRESVDALEDLPLFTTLIGSGYDTASYRHKFWELAYYRHWKHGDIAVERWGEPRGLKRFAEIRERYLEETRARTTLEAELAQVGARRAQIEGLAARREQLATSLETLEDRHWAQTRARVHEHLSQLLDDVPALLASYEPGLYAAKRVLGMLAKQRYLIALRDAWIDAPLEQVERKLAKVRRGSVKFRRPKHAHRNFDADQMQRKYAIPQASWDKRWRKWDATYPRIADYDRYDRYDFDADTIWWHEMTEGASKARFIDEVSVYYQRKQFERQVNSRERWTDDDARGDAIAAIAEDTRQAGALDDGWGDIS